MFRVIIITLCMTAALWYAVHRFVGGTAGLPDALDIGDVRPIDLEARAARLEAERLEAEQNPPPEVRDSLAEAPEPVEHEDGDAELTVATVEREDENEEGDDEQADEEGEEGEADEAPPERPDSDADMLARAEGAPETTVEVEGRDAELERLLEEMDRELLGDSPPTRAVDIGLPIATVVACPEAAGERYRTGVLFRHGSAAIKGRSLTRIDELLTLWRACGGGEIRVEPNPQGDADGDEELARRRRDEVKYYLLQRRVPGADIAFGERS